LHEIEEEKSRTGSSNYQLGHATERTAGSKHELGLASEVSKERIVY